MNPPGLSLRTGTPGSTATAAASLPGGRRVVLVEVTATGRRQGLSTSDGADIAAAADLARTQRLPLVLVLSLSGVDARHGMAALDGWGRAARAVTACSGLVPVIVVAPGTVISASALLLGLADAVVMTGRTLAYVSGPAAVAAVTGWRLDPSELGGPSVHARSTGVVDLVADGREHALELAEDLLSYLPDHSDELAVTAGGGDPPERATPELRDILPATDTGSYDVRDVIRSVADDGDMLELRPAWAPQLVTALVRVGGRSVGVVANQPRTMAGTLDIAAAQKGARFVRLCDAFNVSLLTLVDTPGFMPGKDLEWRGMIRHGAQLVYAYAQASVPRVCLVMRKAFGGAYIVMDSKAMGNDVCLAWPSAQVAVMGAEGAVQILHRRASAADQVGLADRYRGEYLNPYVAAARGFVDAVIDPADTRRQVHAALDALATKRERLPGRKHGNCPL